MTEKSNEKKFFKIQNFRKDSLSIYVSVCVLGEAAWRWTLSSHKIMQLKQTKAYYDSFMA